MLFQQTQEKLQTMRLGGMRELNERHQDDLSVQKLNFDERFGLLVEAEEHYREQRRQERFTKAAKLKETNACIEDINYSTNRQLDRGQMTTLAKCRWLRRNQHLIINGPTGVGKTWLACALAHQAIRKGHKVLYKRVSRLLEEADIARADGTLPNFRLRLSKFKLLILDDWAVNPIHASGRQDLLELVEDKMGSGSILITSQLPINQWHEWLGDATIADAILDRIVHRAHVLNLQGESLRKTESLDEEDNQ